MKDIKYDSKKYEGMFVKLNNDYIEKYLHEPYMIGMPFFIDAYSTRIGFIRFTVADIYEFFTGKQPNAIAKTFNNLIDILNSHKSEFFIDADDIVFSVNKRAYVYRLQVNDQLFGVDNDGNQKSFIKIYYNQFMKIFRYKNYVPKGYLKKWECPTPLRVLQFFVYFKAHQYRRGQGDKINYKQEVLVSYTIDLARELNFTRGEPEKCISVLKGLNIIATYRPQRTKQDLLDGNAYFTTNRLIIADYKIKGEINEFTGLENKYSHDDEFEYSKKYIKKLQQY